MPQLTTKGFQMAQVIKRAETWLEKFESSLEKLAEKLL